MAASKKAIFWDVAPCSLTEIDKHFRGAYCLHHQGTHHPDNGGNKCQWVNFYETTEHSIPENSLSPMLVNLLEFITTLYMFPIILLYLLFVKSLILSFRRSLFMVLKVLLASHFKLPYIEL
jgi:hypothetical protein